MTVAWKTQRTRALDLAVLQAETAQLQVEALRAEQAELHRELARRDVELISALARVTAVTDQLRLQNDEDRSYHDRLARAIELLTLFIASPPPALRGSTPGSAAAISATVIGGSVDPSRLDITSDATIDLTDLPVAPETAADGPLRCEVHLRFGDRWIDGFQIEETVHGDGRTRFRLRRRVDGWVLPELFDESEVRVFTHPGAET